MKANDRQHGGSHYKSLAIQPWDYIESNNIPYLEGSAIKYLTRWRDKGGITDLKKAIHFIEKRIEFEEEKGAKSEPARNTRHSRVPRKVGRVGRVPKKPPARKVQDRPRAD